MIRWALVRGKRYPVPLPPSPAPYANLLKRFLREIEDIYLEALGGAPREDAIPRAKRRRIVDLLRNTDRSRDFSEHGISILVDGFEQMGPIPDLVDAAGRAIERSSNAGFDSLIKAQAGGRKIQASIAAVDLQSKTSGMGNFIELFRRDNTDLIRRLIARHVANTEKVLADNYGEHVSVLSEKIREATGTTENHAVLLARDQTLKVNADIQAFRAKSVGADWYTWVTSNDERVRGRPGGKWANSQSNHWKLNGQRFRYSDPPLTNAKKGIRLNPGRDFQCRCTATPDLSHIFDD